MINASRGLALAFVGSCFLPRGLSLYSQPIANWYIRKSLGDAATRCTNIVSGGVGWVHIGCTLICSPQYPVTLRRHRRRNFAPVLTVYFNPFIPQMPTRYEEEGQP